MKKSLFKNSLIAAGILIIAAVLIAVTIGLSFDSLIGAEKFGKTAVTGVNSSCSYSAEIMGSTEVKAGESIVLNLTVRSSNCIDEAAAVNVGLASKPNDSVPDASAPACSATGPISITKDPAKTTITCQTTSSTPAGRYTYIVEVRSDSGMMTQIPFGFNVTSSAQACNGLNLSTDKQDYKTGETITLTYSCGNNQAANTIKIQVCPDSTCDEKSDVLTILDNTASGTYSIPTASYTTTGSYLIRTCIFDSPPADLYSKSCPISSTNSISVNITSSTTGTPTYITPASCKTNEKCPANSWCENGQQFYYPTGEITCLPWTGDVLAPPAPTGTSDCRPDDTACVSRGQIVPYSSGKWCSKGTQYYSIDGKNMTCANLNESVPAGYTDCAPDNKQCIPSGSYGASDGWCARGMKFYQIAKDNNANNDAYCAPYTYTTPAVSATMSYPTAPAGYSVCNPTDTYCKQKGDTWTDSNTGYYCMNGQKCTSASSSSCVGWDEQCPAGTKYCTGDSSEYCVEPGEYKTISKTPTMGSYWCGGGNGMTFYSQTQAYCEPKKAGTGTAMMWTGADIKAVLEKLGTEWGLCPKATTSTAYSQCIEPGKTGPSTGWCAWYPPATTMAYPSYSPTAVTRTCPSLDGTMPEEKKEEMCIQVLTQAYNPITNECKTFSTPCEVPKDWTKGTPPSGKCATVEPIKKPVCPAVSEITTCPKGQTLIKEITPDGCGTIYCKSTGEIKPKPPEKCPEIQPIICPVGRINKIIGADGCSYVQCSSEQPPKECPTLPPVVCPAGQVPTTIRAGDRCPIVECSKQPGIEPLPITPILPSMPPGQNQCKMLREENRMYKYEIKNMEQNLKFLPKEVEVPASVKELIAKIKSIYAEIEKTFAGLKECEESLYQQGREKLNNLNASMMDLREQMQSLQVYGRCAQFQKDIKERAKMLKEESKRMKKGLFDEEIKDFGGLAAKSKETCKAIDQFAMEDLEFDRRDIEDRVSDKYQETAEQNKYSYIMDTITSIRTGITVAKNSIEREGLADKEQCVKAANILTQVNAMTLDAEKSFKEGGEEAAGEILDKIERFKEPVTEALKQCGVRLEIETQNASRVFVGDVKEEVIERIVEKVVSKFAAVLDERMKELTTKIAQITEQITATFQAKLQESLTALQAVPKGEAREKVEEAKTAVIDATTEVQGIKNKLPSAHASRLMAVLEKAAGKNWCGDLAEQIKKEAESLKTKAIENDIGTEDITALEQLVVYADSRNNDECYKVGASKFRIDTSAWYFPYFQTSTAFKGTVDASGNPTGDVEPARAALRPEALIAIERAMGFSEADGKCELKVDAKDVPEWAKCAVNVAGGNEIDTAGSWVRPATRDEVASWTIALAKNRLPAMGTDEYIKKFSDIKTCKDTNAVSTMVANKIMVGSGGEGMKWGCGQPLLRAELAAILNRVSDLMGLVK